MSDASARTADFPAPMEPVIMSKSIIAISIAAVDELAGVVVGVEVAKGVLDEAVGGELPGFEAADANFFAGAARAGVGARERPVKFDTRAVLPKVIEGNFHVRKSNHEGTRGFCEGGSADTWSTIVNFE